MQFIPISYSITPADHNLYVSDVHVVASIQERDNLIVQEGDIAKVTGDKTYIYDGTNWLTLNDNNGSVQSVNTINPVNGDVTIKTKDVTEDTNLYFTNQRAIDALGSVVKSVNSVNPINGNVTLNLVTNLSDLGDVQLNSVSNNQMLRYSTVNNKFNNVTMILDYISNVLFTNLQNGEYLKYDGANWVNSQISQYSDSDVLAYIKTIMTTSGDLLIRSGTDILRLGIGTANQVLTVNNSLPSWKTPTAGSQTLAGLTDVTITNIADYQYIYYDSGTQKYINGKVFDLEKTSQDVSYDTPPNNGMGLLRVSGKWSPRYLRLSNLTGDVTITNQVNGNVLQYNGNNWTNTNTLSTAVTNISTLNTTVTQLANNQYIQAINPAPNTTQAITYDQPNHPVNISNYEGLIAVNPQSNLGVVQWAPTTILPYPNAYYWTNSSEVGGNYTGTMSNKLSQYFNANFGSGFPKEAMFQVVLNTWTGGTYDRATVFNINFHDNPVAVTGGSVVKFRNSTFTAGTNNLTNAIAVYGLIDATGTNLTSMFDGTFGFANAFPPTNTNVWIELLPTTITNTSGGGVIQTFTCNNADVQIHAISIYHLYMVNNRNTYCYWQQSTPISENSVIPTNITYSKSTGSLILTNVNAGRLNERWSLNLQNLMLYDYINQIVPVIRGTNSLYLSNTQFTDSNIRVNNGVANYQIQNSTGSQTWSIFSNGGIYVPNNRSCMFSFYTGTSFTVTLTNINTWYEVINNITTLNSNGATSFVLIGGNRMICSTAGTYCFNVTINAYVGDPNELTFYMSREQGNVQPTNWYTGSVMIGVADGKYQCFHTSFIATCAANDYVSIYCNKKAGGGGKVLSVMSYTVTITNLLNN